MFPSAIHPPESLYDELERVLRAADDNQALRAAISQTPFDHEVEMGLLFLGFITYFVVEPKQKRVVIASVTDNEYYRQSVAGYDFCLSDYKVPLSAKENSVIQAITTGQPVTSDNWDSFRRPKVEEGIARLNQANSGIGYSVVYPVDSKPQSALMFNFFQYPEAIGEAHQNFMQRYVDIVAEALA